MGCTPVTRAYVQQPSVFQGPYEAGGSRGINTEAFEPKIRIKQRGGMMNGYRCERREGKQSSCREKHSLQRKHFEVLANLGSVSMYVFIVKDMV